MTDAIPSQMTIFQIEPYLYHLRQELRQMAKRAGGTTSQTGLRDKLGRGKKADWSDADAEQLRNTIASVARSGGALRLGYSRDGGAYAIGVYGDGDPYTLYTPPSDDINATLAEIENAFSNIA